MEENLRKAFKNMQSANAEIPELVFARITKIAKRRAQLKKFGYASFSIISFGLLFPAFNMLILEVKTSGFFEYLSLAFSLPALRTAGVDLVLLLAETLPALSLATCFGLLVFMFLGVHGALKMKVNRLQVI